MHCTGWRLLQHLPKLLPIDLHLTTGLLFYSLFHKTCQPLKQNFKPDIRCWLVSRSSLNMMLQVLRTVEPKFISVKIRFCNKVSSGHPHPHNGLLDLSCQAGIEPSPLLVKAQPEGLDHQGIPDTNFYLSVKVQKNTRSIQLRELSLPLSTLEAALANWVTYNSRSVLSHSSGV